MPVWDAFLTPRDKLHLAQGYEKKELFGFGERPALLMIDDYYGVLGEEPMDILESVKRWPSSCGLEGWEAIAKTVPLLKAARENGIPVTYCAGIPGFPSPWGRRTKRRETSMAEQEWQYTIAEEIAPLPGELVVRKAAPSAFFGTALISHLIYLGVDTIIACGETTSGCVRASVIDGCTYRFRMGVVEECTFDRTQASHAINLFDMHQKYADVINLEQAIAYFDKIGGRIPTLVAASA